MSNPIRMEAWGTRSLRKTVPYEPGTVLGWLTVVKQCDGIKSNSVFLCRCGERLTRKHADVRESVAKGCYPSCLKCRSAAMKEAAEMRAPK